MGKYPGDETTGFRSPAQHDIEGVVPPRRRAPGVRGHAQRRLAHAYSLGLGCAVQVLDGAHT